MGRVSSLELPSKKYELPNAINQLFFRCRSSIEKHLHIGRHEFLENLGISWESGGLPREKFSKILCSRTSENVFYIAGKCLLLLIFILRMGSMVPSSNLYFTNMKTQNFHLESVNLFVSQSNQTNARRIEKM